MTVINEEIDISYFHYEIRIMRVTYVYVRKNRSLWLQSCAEECPVRDLCARYVNAAR